jgi:hypothetical protein
MAAIKKMLISTKIRDRISTMFYESFWLATSAAAPVIALAAVVSIPDSTNTASVAAFRSKATVGALQPMIDRLRNELEQVKASRNKLTDPVSLELQSSPDITAIQTELDSAMESLEDNDRYAEVTRRAAMNAVWSSINVLVQSGLLAVSLTALAYDRDIVPPWLAIVLAVGGLLLLAWTVVSGAAIRSQIDQRDKPT